ncbi:DUF4167 domain-containing protein [Tsuneonella sp. HG249]
MNNNRNQNRRRGRGNRQQGGGNQNRIDSRARGNAPQMFDKYKKLAQDAAHNGDRVQAEYYLQFADHYFRVIADNKARMDEQRGGPRRDERDFNAEEEGEDDDFDILRQPQGRYSERQNERQGGERQGGERQSGDRSNDRQRQRPRRDDRDREDEARPRDEGDQGYEGEEAMDFAPAENPFVRPPRDRARDNDRPREGTSRRGRGQRGGSRENAEPSPVDDGGEIDAAALPPSFSASIAETDSEEAAPKRKLPPRRRRTPIDEAGDDGETLKAVG